MASQRILLYTLTASLPLLAIITALCYGFHISSFSGLITQFIFYNSCFSTEIIALLRILRFLVKFPMFILHLWLPKAHVEASISGSIILAGILLKLGGYAAIRFSPLFYQSLIIKPLIMAISLMGGAIIRVLCVTQIDIKVIIAYSSVSHIRFAIAGILSGSNVGCSGAILILLAHGFTSCLIFYSSNMAYQRSGSRNLIISTGIMKMLPILSLIWAIVVVSNLAGPPFLNLFTEILLILSLSSTSLTFIFPLGVMAFMRAAYSLLLYAHSNHGNHYSIALAARPLLQVEYFIALVHILMITTSTVLFLILTE